MDKIPRQALGEFITAQNKSTIWSRFFSGAKQSKAKLPIQRHGDYSGINCKKDYAASPHHTPSRPPEQTQDSLVAKKCGFLGGKSPCGQPPGLDRARPGNAEVPIRRAKK